MATIFTESFETDGNGTRYTTSIPEFTDGSADFFTRTEGSNITSNYVVNGFDGSFFFAAQDIDGEGAAPQQTLSFSGIDISGFTNLNFSALFAEDDDGANQDWDEPDFVRVEYQIDGGGFVNLLAFENDGSPFNSAPLQDTDFDGTGDGNEVTSTFTTFSEAIAGTGSTLDLQITFNLDSGDEDIAIDNIQISGDAAVAPTPDIVINEMVVSTAGTDREFIELLGAASSSLDGVFLLEVTSGGVIDTVIDFSGASLGTDGLFLAASPEAEAVLGVTGDFAIANNTFTNSSQTYLLVQDFTGSTGEDLDTDDDGTLDSTPWTTRLDDVAFIANDSPIIYSNNIVGPDGSFLAPGGFRSPDGSGDFTIHAFSDSTNYTPGALNDAPPPAPTLVINEVDADQASTDSAEFIELFDGGVGNTALDGLVLVLYNGSDNAVYDAIDLDGQTTDAGGYFVVGSANVPNVDLVEFTTNGIQNGADAVALYTGDAADFPDGTAVTNANLVDAIVYGTSDANDTELLNGLGQSTQFDENVNSNGVTESNSRVPNGTGDFVAQAPTPGTANEPGGGNGSGEVTLISAIQGGDDASPLQGETVTVEAIVVGDFQDGDADTGRNLGGFYLQEEDSDADGDASTSEGIFVFEGGNFITDVNVGDRVRITGVVDEFFGETQIESISGFTVLDSDNSLPTAATISLPSAAVTTSQDGDFQPDLEAFEGMRVSFSDELTITEMFQLDRFNEIKLSQGGRLEQFTQNNLPDVNGYAQHLQDIGARTITYDDGLNVQNADIGNLDGFGPIFNTANAPRMGDTITGLEGVLSYQWAGNAASGATWRVRSAVDGTNTFTNENPRPATPADVGGTLKVASFNVLNFFTTLDTFPGNEGVGPNDLEPRGADTNPQNADPTPGETEEYDRQLAKLVEALVGADADVVGLVELENDFLKGGDSPNDADAQAPRDVAIQELVNAVNAELGAEVYDWVRPGQEFVGGDAIAVGFIYDTTTVNLAGNAAILDAPSFLDPNNTGQGRNRAALAQTFAEVSSGETFTAVINHFKSKGDSGLAGDDPNTNPDVDQLDGQGFWNDTRTDAAIALANWLQSDPTGAGDEDYMILGDLNAYANEDPIRALEQAGYTDLAEAFIGEDAYSFVFDGQTGTLDYALANSSLLSQVTGVTEWHINADEADALDYNLEFGRDPSIFDGTNPFRASDHDPVIVGLNLFSEPSGPAITNQTTLDGTPINDLLEDESLGELIRDFGTGGPNGYVNLGSKLKNSGALRDFLFNDQTDAGFQSMNGVQGIDGIRIAAIPDTSPLGQLLDTDSDTIDTTAYAISVQDDASLVESRIAGWDVGDFAAAFGDPLAFDDGTAAVNEDGTTIAVFKDLVGLIGTQYSDFFSGGTEEDYFAAGNGDDQALGQAGNDRLLGGRGADNLAGGADRDQIRGGHGDDLLRGGDNFGSFGPEAGDGARDTFVFEAVNNGNDRITDFEIGLDRLAFRIDRAGKVELGDEIDRNGNLVITISNFVGQTGSVTLDGIDTAEEFNLIENQITSWGNRARFSTNFDIIGVS